MFDQDKGLGEAMGRSHDRDTVAKLAAIVLKAISGMPVTPAEIDELRKIAEGDKIQHVQLTDERIRAINQSYAHAQRLGY